MILKSPYKLKTFISLSKINITIGIFGCVFCVSFFTCFNFLFQWIFLNTFHRAYLQCCFELSLLIREIIPKTVKKFRPWKVFYCSISKSNSFIITLRRYFYFSFSTHVWTWVYDHVNMLPKFVGLCDKSGIHAYSYSCISGEWCSWTLLKSFWNACFQQKIEVSILYQWFWIANTPSI